MALARARIGFGLAAAGQVAYLPQQPDVGFVLSTMVAASGFPLCAAAARRGARIALGLSLAASAALVDSSRVLAGGFDMWFVPQALWTFGLIMAFTAARARGHDFGVRAGAWTAAVASSLWVVLDPFNVTLAWLPGVVLSLVGCALVGSSFGENAPAEDPVEAPA